MDPTSKDSVHPKVGFDNTSYTATLQSLMVRADIQISGDISPRERPTAVMLLRRTGLHYAYLGSACTPVALRAVASFESSIATLKAAGDHLQRVALGDQ